MSGQAKRARNRRVIALFAGFAAAGAVGLCLLLSGALARAAEPGLGPRHGVLLLKNGSLVEGQITPAGDRYDVVIAGGEIHLKRGEVEYVGSSVDDCYQRRKAAAENGKVQQQLDLAEWCLRQRLFNEAALALAAAVEADATHPRIGLLERRLKLALTQPGPAASSAAAGRETLSARDLDRMVRGLPNGSVELFTSTIQPLLVNHCSTAGCHGPQSATEFRLLRIPSGTTPSRRATQRNLYAALSVVDRQQPDQSKLLLVPTRPHGNAKAAIFTTREAAQYQQLLRWVYGVSGKLASEVAPAAAANASPFGGLPPAPKVARKAKAKAKPARPTDPSVSGVIATSGTEAMGEQVSSERGKGSRAGYDAQGAADANPLDPEAFNRHYAPAAAEEEESLDEQ